jgi:hypothetical protein
MTSLSAKAVAVRIAVLGFLAVGAVRFIGAGLLPATQALRGDFGASFPTAYFARWRPDIPTDQVWTGWNYGPMLHILTAPLLLAPRWSMVPLIWSVVNLLALAASFFLILRLDERRRPTWPLVAFVAALWLLYQPLATCFSQGNVEIIELTLIVAALVWRDRARGMLSGGLIAIAAMIKFLPVGFLFWFLIRRRYVAFVTGIAVIMVIIVATSLTLGWNKSISLDAMTWAGDAPIAGLHELSVTSLILHRASVLDYENSTLRWFPSARAAIAGRIGGVTSSLLAVAFALALFSNRRQPVSTAEIAVWFMTMFMILPWNHD